jgi:hypothetical protein
MPSKVLTRRHESESETVCTQVSSPSSQPKQRKRRQVRIIESLGIAGFMEEKAIPNSMQD